MIDIVYYQDITVYVCYEKCFVESMYMKIDCWQSYHAISCYLIKFDKDNFVRNISKTKSVNFYNLFFVTKHYYCW